MSYSIHAGHAASGNRFCGAVGFVNESDEARAIKNAVLNYLPDCVDITVESDNVSTFNLLFRLINKANELGTDYNIAIHLNALNTSYIDNISKGVEVWVYSENSKLREAAGRICSNIAKLGFTNRGVKFNKNYTFLKRTHTSSMIIECFFCDDEDDVNIYRKYGADVIGRAIVSGLMNVDFNINNSSTTPTPAQVNNVASNVTKESEGEQIVNIELNVLRNGCNGPQVVTVQMLLKEKGYKDASGNALICDGKWGKKTDCAFKSFQSANGLVTDCVCGAKSWEMLLK